MNKLNTLFCFVLLFTLSCIDKKEKYNKDQIQDKEIIQAQNDLIKAINEGDFASYNRVSNYYILKDNWVDFYYYALLMANKYNCPEAHYHLYTFLTDKVTVNGVYLFSYDMHTINLSYYHLLKSYELGYVKSIDDVHDIFKGKKIPNSKDILLN